MDHSCLNDPFPSIYLAYNLWIRIGGQPRRGVHCAGSTNLTVQGRIGIRAPPVILGFQRARSIEAQVERRVTKQGIVPCRLDTSIAEVQHMRAACAGRQPKPNVIIAKEIVLAEEFLNIPSQSDPCT